MGAKDIANKLLVVIAGPTASGKTSVSIQLARHYQTEIINADSRQVYKELSIGVGKPTTEQLTTVPHYLIGHTTIFEHYSAGHFIREAQSVIEKLFEKHDIIILSGGTGLYIKSLLYGLDEIPVVPESIIQHWINIRNEQGIEPLIARLKEVDPDYLKVVDTDNPTRLIRAISVSEYSGQPYSSFRKGAETNHPFKTLFIALNLPRKELYERINNRVHDMISKGWMKEAIELYPHRELKALQTVGYKELFEVIDGKLSIEDAIPMIQQSTRRYAKRQLTWLRNQGEWNWIHPDDLSGMMTMIDQALRSTKEN